ncbi:lysylphosphatidylglycerol synthase transmembrane domain-containing protein [Gaiella sp.]|uniref:lysylphosphatidylglycerol synthase transmembrane domain-containing protein n=1 Tax=Gaiella sp. TaxID=2663207 RepID=UPI0039832CDB
MSDLERVTPSRGRGGALLAVGIASSVFFVWLVFRDADLDAVWAALSSADVGLVAMAAAVIQIVYVAQGARWRIIAATLELTVKRFYALVLGGIGANNILPLRIGDLLRARWLAKSAAIPSGRAFGSVFRDRACDVLTLVIALAVSLPVVGDPAWVNRIALGGTALVAVLALAIGGAVVYSRKRPRARRESRTRARQLLRDTVDEVASPIGRRRLALALGLSVIAWGAWAVTAGLISRSLGFSLSPIELVFVTAVINLGVVIPSSPGFIGTYQWLAVSALGVVGIDGEVAIAFSLLMQSIWFIPTTIAGGVIAVREINRDARRPSVEGEPPVPSPG